MSFTAASIISGVRLKYNDLEDTAAVIYLNEVVAEVRAKLNLRRTTVSITSLAVGTREYAEASLLLGVDEVRYQRTSTTDDFAKLIPLSGKEEAYAKIQEFQKLENGEPRWFYLSRGTTGPVIGLIPCPDTATSGGYPKLDMDVTQGETLTTGSTLYDDLPSADVFVSGVKYKYARDKYPEDADYWENQFRQAIARAQAFLLTKNRQAPPQISPRHMRRRTPVR